MINDPNDKILTDVEAAEYIGMSRSWLRQARVTGNPDAPPFFKISRAVRYSLKDLERWLAQKRQNI